MKKSLVFKDPSPWGWVQTEDQLMPGIWNVSTSGHGGIAMTPEEAKKLTKVCQSLAIPEAGFYWFEEDVRIAVPLLEVKGLLQAMYPLKSRQWMIDMHTEMVQTMGRYHPNYSAPTPSADFFPQRGVTATTLQEKRDLAKEAV